MLTAKQIRVNINGSYFFQASTIEPNESLFGINNFSLWRKSKEVIKYEKFTKQGSFGVDVTGSYNSLFFSYVRGIADRGFPEKSIKHNFCKWH